MHRIRNGGLDRGADLLKELPWQRPADAGLNLGMGKFENLVIRIRMCPALTEKGSAKMQNKTQQNHT